MVAAIGACWGQAESNPTSVGRIIRVNLGLLPASELLAGREKSVTSKAILF